VAPAPSALPKELEAFRSEVPLLRSTIYLANCSQGPLARPVREAVEGFLATWTDLGMHWDEWVEEVERARAAFAGLIGASAEDVAVGTSESQLASSVASALVARERRDGTRRRIVSSRLEFPGVAHAWLATTRSGWAVDQVDRTVEEPLAAEDFVPFIGGSTALVSLPHVVYANGAKVDPGPVVEAAHGVGASVYLDAYQSMGTMGPPGSRSCT
jgi:selenocysteine lyase/cysteine desulfurase